MPLIDSVTGTPELTMSPVGLQDYRRQGIAVLAPVLIATQPVSGRGSNESTGRILTNSPMVVDQTGDSDVHGKERSATPADSTQEREEGLAEADVDHVSAEKYHLVLGESVFNHTCLT